MGTLKYNYLASLHHPSYKKDLTFQMFHHCLEDTFLTTLIYILKFNLIYCNLIWPSKKTGKIQPRTQAILPPR